MCRIRTSYRPDTRGATKASVLAAVMVFSMAVRPAAANRVFSSGFELGASGNNVEWGSGPTLPSVTTLNVRTGTYAGFFKDQFFSQNFLGQTFYVQLPPAVDYYARCYIRFTSFPSAETTIMRLEPGRVTIDGAGTLRVRDTNGASTSGSTLSTGTYYRLELRTFTGGATGADEVRMRLDGSDDAAIVGVDYATTPVTLWEVGRIEATTPVQTGAWNLDDCGLNDTLGTDNNGESSWPGAGSIVHLRPNGEGDPDASAGLSEVGPKGPPVICGATIRAQCLASLDESRTYVGLDRADAFVDVDVEEVLLPVDSQVQFVAVGIRFTCESDRPCNHILGVKSISGGTVASAVTGITLGSPFLWWTHSDDEGQRRHRLVQYRDPQDVSRRWINSTLDSLQLRIATTDGNPDTNVTTAWVLVEYEPQSAPAAALGSE